MRLLRNAALVLVVVIWAGLALAEPPPMTAETSMEYLVQSNCIDQNGQVQRGILPFQRECIRPASLFWFQGMAYRKHDWPAPEHRAGAPLGYQASDAYIGRLRGALAAVQTFDFGGGPYRFGRFDLGVDGGDAVVLRGTEASIGLSQDSDGVKWLLGRGCAPGAALAPGWLVFQGPRGERIAPNAIAASPDSCPRAFTMSLTRWHSDQLNVPYMIRGRAAGAFHVAVIISEHYTHPTVEQSNAMEKFFYGGGFAPTKDPHR